MRWVFHRSSVSIALSFLFLFQLCSFHNSAAVSIFLCSTVCFISGSFFLCVCVSLLSSSVFLSFFPHISGCSLLIHHLVMQEDTNVLFEKRGTVYGSTCRRSLSHLMIDSAHCCTRVCPTSSSCCCVQNTETPCGKRALYQHPCCFVVFPTCAVWTITVIKNIRMQPAW